MYLILVCATGARCRSLYPAVTVLQGAASTHTLSRTPQPNLKFRASGLICLQPSKAKASHSYTAVVILLPPVFPSHFFLSWIALPAWPTIVTNFLKWVLDS